MIDRDQVLHVAKLARLRLSDEEVDRMAGELSKILEHVETINELDLDGVEPTSHVVDLDQRAARGRAAAEPAARGRARAGARRHRERLPRADARSVVSDELLDLTAAQQAERDRAPAT